MGKFVIKTKSDFVAAEAIDVAEDAFGDDSDEPINFQRVMSMSKDGNKLLYM